MNLRELGEGIVGIVLFAAVAWSGKSWYDRLPDEAERSGQQTPKLVKLVNTTNLNLRSGPGPQAAKLKELPKGTRLEVTETLQNGWDKVIVETTDGTGPPERLAGYVKDDLLTIDASSLAPGGTLSARPTPAVTSPPPPPISSPPLAWRTAVAQVGCNVMSKPSPDEVKAAIIAFWDDERQNRIAYAKQSLADHQQNAPLKSAEQDCSNAGYDCVRYPGGPMAQERCRQGIVQSCLRNRENNMSIERQSRSDELESVIDQYKSAISAPSGQQLAKGLLFCVNSMNLEGNVKSEVYVRHSGDDKVSEFKANLQCMDGRWAATDLQQTGTFVLTPSNPWCQ